MTGSTGRLTAEYDRFERNGASTNLLIRVAAAAGEQATIIISSSFVAAYKIEAMAPEPTEQRSGPDGIELTFMASGQEPVQIYLAIRPEQVGLIDSTIGLPGETPVRLKQFVFP